MSENEGIKLLKNRRSIRKFEARPIEDEILTQILETARWTFSAVNKQPWKLIVIRNKEMITKVASELTSGRFAAKAPVLVALVGDTTIQPEWHIHDLSFLSLQLILAAWSYGIGSCFIGYINRDKVKEILNLDKKDHVLTVLPLGYPKGNIPKAPPRKTLNEIIKYID